MSKKNRYKRTHQFTPYTKADGAAVSDEFDAIQAVLDLIPELRDDGKGFAASPVIPTPTEPNHPVPYSMLTETEKSVNNARDEVLEKAQQVAKNTETVATNTQTAINQASSATQSATSAAESSRSADESEDWARKWASNPVNEAVSGDKYSAYHYATKAAKSAENLSTAEISAKSNADIATQKAEEAKLSAKKAESLAHGEVEYEKILNVPRADTSTAGVVRLTSDTGLDSENLGLTAKVGKLFAQSIAALRLALNNYIPLNKRSSSVNSDSNENVATSAAVKKAYDKGVEAKAAADNAQQTANAALPLKNIGSKSIVIGNYNFIFQTDGNLVITNNSTNEVLYAASRWVSKLGDTMTGILRTSGITSPQLGFGSYRQQYTSGAPFMVESKGSKNRDTYHPFIKGLVRSEGNYGAVFSFGYTTRQDEGDGFGRGIIHLIDGNGSSNLWEFEHNGDFNSSGDVRSSSGKSLNNAVQLSDFQYQRISVFEVLRYPDGCMIITVNKQQTDIYANKKTEFTWPIAFISTPVIIGKWTTSSEAGVDVGVNVHTSSNNTKCVFYEYEHGNINQGECRLQMIAIGRWK